MKLHSRNEIKGENLGRKSKEISIADKVEENSRHRGTVYFCFCWIVFLSQTGLTYSAGSELSFKVHCCIAWFPGVWCWTSVLFLGSAQCKESGEHNEKSSRAVDWTRTMSKGSACCVLPIDWRQFCTGGQCPRICGIAVLGAGRQEVHFSFPVWLIKSTNVSAALVLYTDCWEESSSKCHISPSASCPFSAQAGSFKRKTGQAYSAHDAIWKERLRRDRHRKQVKPS